MDENIFELKKEDYIRNRIANIELVKMNLMQIKMAKKVIIMCDEEIAEYPEEIINEKIPTGVY